MKKLLSIIIPTRNRNETILKLLRSLEFFDRDFFQVVVMDNSDQNDLEYKVNDFNIDIIYRYSSEKLSFVDNFNNALEMATGEYYCFVGDDDAVNIEILDIVKWANANGVKSIQYQKNISYLWPFNDKNTKSDGKLIIRGNAFISKKINTHKNLKKMFGRGDATYNRYLLNDIYHGIIHKSLIENIKSKTTVLFGGLTPDIYSAISLTIAQEKSFYFSFPFTYHGVSRKSGASDSINGRHTGELKDAPHFYGHSKYEWHEKVPRFYSVETIWADTALHAMEDSNNQHKFIFNFNKFYYTLYFKYPKYRNYVLMCSKSNKATFIIKSYFHSSIQKLHNISLKFFRLIRFILFSRKEYNGIESIIETRKKLDENSNFMYLKASLSKFLSKEKKYNND